MKTHFLPCLALLALLAGCAPRVVTDMFTAEYAPTSPDSVRVFLLNEPLPAHSLAIGEVKVVDNGFSVRGDYNRVLRMAIEAAAANGGNGLVITDHRTPDFVSSINRVWGTIVRMPQTAADSTAAQSVQAALDEAEYDEFRQYQQWKRNMQQAASRQQAWRDGQPRNIVRVNIGPSWLTSKYQIGSRLYKSRSGIDLEAGYDHVWRSGFGVGVNYLHNRTTFPEDVTTRINYVGPSLVLALPYGPLRFDMAFGAGYARYSESWHGQTLHEDRVAPFMRCGMEYLVAKNMAVGLQLYALTVHMHKPEGVVLEKNEFYGIQRTGIAAGLRIYL